MSAPLVWEACRGAEGPVGPFRTTDYFLSSLLGTPGGSERLLHVFSALPAKAPVAVVIPEGDLASNFTAYILTYFGWPREVRLIAVKPENAASQLQTLEQTPFAAIFYCKVTPPASRQPVVRLGRNLVVTPTATR